MFGATAPIAPATFFADKEKDASTPSLWNRLALETGFKFLTEDGEFILKENL